jgi:acetyltransferase-like isoleucine patch superfamily enzyme
MKLLLSYFMLPFACLAEALTPLTRLWAWTRLRCALPVLAPDCVVLGTVELHGSRRISTGKQLFFYPGLYLETQGNGSLAIGDGVVISRGVHIVAYADMTIGAGTMIGEYTSIRDANHGYSGTSALRESTHDVRPVQIGANVWIGRGVTVLPGVMIGDHAVIGANAVVTRNVAAGDVVAGIPARPINSKRSSLPATAIAIARYLV